MHKSALCLSLSSRSKLKSVKQRPLASSRRTTETNLKVQAPKNRRLQLLLHPHHRHYHLRASLKNKREDQMFLHKMF